MKPIFKKHHVKSISTDNFVMNPVELKDHIDFEVKRVYYLTDITGPGGGHCHKTEKELFILLRGTGVAHIDQGNGMEKIDLETNDALYVGNYVWHHFEDLSSDAVLLALSSTNYDPTRSDYIEDYEEYKRIFTE